MPTKKEEMLYATLRDDLPVLQGKPDLYLDASGEIVDWKTGAHAVLNDSLKIFNKNHSAAAAAAEKAHAKQLLNRVSM